MAWTTLNIAIGLSSYSRWATIASVSRILVSQRFRRNFLHYLWEQTFIQFTITTAVMSLFDYSQYYHYTRIMNVANSYHYPNHQHLITVILIIVSNVEIYITSTPRHQHRKITILRLMNEVHDKCLQVRGCMETFQLWQIAV